MVSDFQSVLVQGHSRKIDVGISGMQECVSRQSTRQNWWVIAAFLVPLTCIAIVLQLRTYPNHDVAWVLWGTRELLNGAQWGVDIIEPNPPLAWYLSMPTTAVAEWLNVPLDWTFRIAVAIAGGLSTACFVFMLKAPKARSAFLSAIIGAAVLVLPGREFGQREHLALIAALPYLALAARRMSNQSTSSWAAIAIGSVAGLGFAFKPYLLAVPLLVELAVQWRSRYRTSLFRPENIALAAVIALYVLEIFAFEFEYIETSVPLANKIYWSFNKPESKLLTPLMYRLVIVFPFIIYAVFDRDEVPVTISAACLGFVFSYVVQQKGYSYHLLPVSILSLALLAYLITKMRRFYLVLTVAALIGLIFIVSIRFQAWQHGYGIGGTQALEVNAVANSIENNAKNGRFLVVSVHPYPTFPTAIYTPARQVSRTNSQWFLPAVIQLRSGMARREDQAEIEQHARDFIMHDLSQHPDLVLIDTDAERHTESVKDFDILGFYLEDEKFRAVWSNYVEIEPVGSLRQFVRKHD